MSLLIDLLHQGPVSWQTSAVPSDGRPRLVFAGSALDHWSSALAAALNAEAELAAAVNELFTCVVLDVAADPAAAAQIQHALHVTVGASGWPVLAVCTPAGEPFGALPWRPIHEVAQVLLQAAEAWHTRPADCRADAARIAAAWQEIHLPGAGRPLRPALLLDAAEAAAMEIADTLEGGFGPAPRTAEPALWSFLIRRAAREDAPLALLQQVERSLAALCAGAAHDHLAGGFFAGCSDAAWSEPACAKGLADQALLADLLLTAGERLGNPLWREVALRTLRFACAALRRDDGTFAHGLHADSPAAPGRWEEGACYRWSAAQVAGIVGEAGAQVISRRFALPAAGVGFLAVGEALPLADQRRLPELVNRLAVARAERPPPRRDDSVYAVEQAQIAYAVERAALIEPEFVAVADALAPHLTAVGPWTGRALAARWRRTSVVQPFAVICGESTSDGDLDPRGGFAPTAVLAQLQLDLAELTGEIQWIGRAEQLLANARDRLRAAPLACAGLLGALDRRHSQP